MGSYLGRRSPQRRSRRVQPYSDDLRSKLLESYEAGVGSLRELAAQFRVSWGYSKKIRAHQVRTGNKTRPEQFRHGPESCMREAVRDNLRNWLREQPDLTEAELRERLAAAGGPGLKEPGRTSSSPDGSGAQKNRSMPSSDAARANRKRREEFLQAIGESRAEKLIFQDESGVAMQMTRQWGRAPKGQRIAEATPQGKWKVLTTLGAMSLRGIEAAMTVEAATDGEVFYHLSTAGALPQAKTRRRAGDGQSIGPQGRRDTRADPGPGHKAYLSAALLARPESHRKSLVKIQAVPSQRQGAN